MEQMIIITLACLAIGSNEQCITYNIEDKVKATNLTKVPSVCCYVGNDKAIYYLQKAKSNEFQIIKYKSVDEFKTVANTDGAYFLGIIKKYALVLKQGREASLTANPNIVDVIDLTSGECVITHSFPWQNDYRCVQIAGEYIVWIDRRGNTILYSIDAKNKKLKLEYMFTTEKR